MLERRYLARIWTIGCVWGFSLLSSLCIPDNKAAIVVRGDNVGGVGTPDHGLQLLLADKGGEAAGGRPEINYIILSKKYNSQ